MNVYMDKWNQIRDKFTDDEKAKLNSLIIGQTICPSGIIIDDKELPDDIREKLKAGVANRYGLGPFPAARLYGEESPTAR